jgi:hypothetical protein
MGDAVLSDGADDAWYHGGAITGADDYDNAYDLPLSSSSEHDDVPEGCANAQLQL